MKKILAGALILAVIGGVLAVVLVDGESKPDSGSSIRQTLSATERAQARGIVARSAGLREILGDRRYEVASIGVWSRRLTQRHREALRSFTPVRVTVDPPRTVTAQWPYIGELQPCEYHWVPIAVKGLREVDVIVDLSHSVVVSIVPSESDAFDVRNAPERPSSPCSA